MDTKLEKKFMELKATIRAKYELSSYLPAPLPKYEDPLEYARKRFWDFDMENWETNEKYRESAKHEMSIENAYVDAYNSILDDLFSVLS